MPCTGSCTSWPTTSGPPPDWGTTPPASTRPSPTPRSRRGSWPSTPATAARRSTTTCTGCTRSAWPAPNRGWRRGPLTDTHRGDLADRLGVAGILTRRRQRHRAEREAWAWWGEELAWMRAPRPPPDLPDPAASLRSLPGPPRRRRYGRHPRRPNRRADFAAALTTLTAAAPHTATAA